jgi:hypothetical protein
VMGRCLLIADDQSLERQPDPVNRSHSRARLEVTPSGPRSHDAWSCNDDDRALRCATIRDLVTTHVSAWLGRGEGPPASGVSPIPFSVFGRTADRDRRPQGHGRQGGQTAGGPQGHAQQGDRLREFALITDGPADNSGGSHSTLPLPSGGDQWPVVSV